MLPTTFKIKEMLTNKCCLPNFLLLFEKHFIEKMIK